MDNQARDNIKAAVYTIGILAAGFFFIFLCNYGNDSEGTSSSQPEPTLSMTPEQVQLVQKLISDGVIRFQSDIRVYVKPVFWSLCDAQKKENFCYLAAKHMAVIRGDNNILIEVYDMQSARKIAKYDALGFKVL